MRAIITGITGQTGSYMADLLLGQDYEVIGLYRRTNQYNFQKIEHLLKNNNLKLVCCDLLESGAINQIFYQYRPEECYHFGAMSHVKISFENPTSTLTTNILGTLNILEAIKYSSPQTKLYNASSSEQFGSERGYSVGGNFFQNEQTRFRPCSPYAVSKLAAHSLIDVYRRSYGLFLCNGISFNHESPRRGENFVTRKITKYVGKLHHYKSTLANSLSDDFPKLKLGNLDARRDWGYAGDVAIAAKLILGQTSPDDYVISTGEQHTIREFLDLAFGYYGLNWEHYVEVDKNLFRPNEVDYLCGDCKKIRGLGWKPTKSFSDLVFLMVEADSVGCYC